MHLSETVQKNVSCPAPALRQDRRLQRLTARNSAGLMILIIPYSDEICALSPEYLAVDDCIRHGDSSASAARRQSGDRCQIAGHQYFFVYPYSPPTRDWCGPFGRRWILARAAICNGFRDRSSVRRARPTSCASPRLGAVGDQAAEQVRPGIIQVPADRGRPDRRDRHHRAARRNRSPQLRRTMHPGHCGGSWPRSSIPHLAYRQ